MKLYRRVFFLLLFFCSFSFASYKSIYDIQNPQFNYSIENNNYKVYMSQEGVINYKKRTGFKLFLPNFVKEYNLGVLRFNSIGRIDGYLSISKEINPYNIIDVQGYDIRYYLTDYAKKDERQLDFLLSGKIIPYIDKTSLAFQGYNIPTKINTHLNKWLYFTFDKHYEDNKLHYLVYSYSMILDKKLVDNFVKQHLKIKEYKDPEFNYIHTYISNLAKLKYFKYPEKKEVKKSKKVKKIHPRITIRLNLKRLLYMKEFGCEQVVLPVKKEKIQIDKKYNELKPYINNLKDAISKIKIPDGYIDLIKNFDEFKSQLEDVINLNEELNRKMEELEYTANKTSIQKRDDVIQCLKFEAPLNKKCLNNSVYVNNYIYYAIKRNELPPEEFILGYGNGKIFNDVGKYYFEIGEYKKSESYLLKAYTLLDGENKKIAAFNLGVLYATINTIEDNKKAVKYFKMSDFKEAYFNLGVNYYIGLGVKEDDKKAFYYFKKASEKGLQRAKFNLDQMKKMHLGEKSFHLKKK